MSTLHVLDDNKQLKRGLDKALKAARADQWPIRWWHYPWEIVAELKLDAGIRMDGDIAICDLYTTNYFTDENPRYPREVSTVDLHYDEDPKVQDLSNIIVAAEDNATHYLKTLHDAGAHVIIFSHVPHLLQKHSPHAALPRTLDQVMDVLLQHAVSSSDDVIVKPELIAGDDDYKRVVERVSMVMEQQTKDER